MSPIRVVCSWPADGRYKEELISSDDICICAGTPLFSRSPHQTQTSCQFADRRKQPIACDYAS